MKKLILLLIFTQLLFSGEDYIFEAISDKSTLYQGEKSTLTYIFKSKKSINIVEREFTPPEFSNFHVRDIVKFDTYEDENYTISKIKYILSPISAQNTIIEPALIDIATAKKKDIGTYKFEDTKYSSIESNTIELKVKKLPQNVKFIGDFSLDVQIDKNQTTSNEALNLTIKIKGSGNIEDMEKFNIDIPYATIYSNTPVITKNLFTQSIAILSFKSYTIKPISLDYYNKKLNKVIKLKSDNFYILVKGEEKKEEITNNLNSIFMILSFILGAIITFFITMFKKKKINTKDMTLIKKLKLTQNKKEILNILLPLAYDKEILKLIQSLEKNLYINQDYKITKKEIIIKVEKIFTND